MRLNKIFMVFWVATFLIASIPKETNAQTVTRLPMVTVTDAGSANVGWTSTPTGITGIQISIHKATGATAGGTVIFERRIDTVLNVWERLDTSTIANQTDQIFIHATAKGEPISGANGYRFVVTGSGTQSLQVRVAYLRR